MGAFELLEKGVTKLKTKNGWIVMPENMGDYGTDYETRAGIALVGLGAIQPHDAFSASISGASAGLSKLAGHGQRGQLAARARKRAIQSHGARLLAEGSGARRHVHASAGKEGAMSVRRATRDDQSEREAERGTER
jgi:hypothetical protein